MKVKITRATWGLRHPAGIGMGQLGPFRVFASRHNRLAVVCISGLYHVCLTW
ncbi:MAG: hypothetical protein WAP74_04010 [Patescibacteria group bacterium]